MIELECPNCAATLQIQKDMDHAFCMYCGTKILLHKAKQGPDVENLLEAASVSLQADDFSSVLNLSNQIIELDSSNALAWAYKGLAFYLVEAKYKIALGYINHAVELDPSNVEVTRIKLRFTAGAEMNGNALDLRWVEGTVKDPQEMYDAVTELLAAFERVLDIYRRLGDTEGQGRSLYFVVRCHAHRGDISTALLSARESLELLSQPGSGTDDLAGVTRMLIKQLSKLE